MFSNPSSNLVIAPFYRKSFMVFIKKFQNSYCAVYLSIIFVDVVQGSGRKCYKIQVFLKIKNCFIVLFLKNNHSEIVLKEIANFKRRILKISNVPEKFIYQFFVFKNMFSPGLRLTHQLCRNLLALVNASSRGQNDIMRE